VVEGFIISNENPRYFPFSSEGVLPYLLDTFVEIYRQKPTMCYREAGTDTVATQESREGREPGVGFTEFSQTSRQDIYRTDCEGV